MRLLKEIVGAVWALFLIYGAFVLLGYAEIPQFAKNFWKELQEKQYAKIDGIFSQMPSDQQAFVGIISRSQQAYDAAPNDLAKGAERLARKSALCGIGLGPAVSGWIGQVSDLSSNNDGFGVIKISVSRNAKVGTWNNSFSDISTNTLIKPQTPLHEQSLKLATGDIVRFDGQLFSGGSDCFREMSVTQAGSMQEPAFAFRFSRIEKRG
ncbi:hypothetical protein ACXIUS_01440 [Bosea thiooxidans]